MRAKLASAVAALTLCVTLLSGCGPMANNDSSRIVVTTNILGDIVGAIVGDEADVAVLMKPNADPHSFAISAQEAHALQTANLVIFNGLRLEEGVLHHVEAASREGVPTFEVGAAVDPIEYTSGDTAGQADPHFWTDPTRVVRAVERITDQVIEHLPHVDANTLRQRAASYAKELTALDALMEQLFQAIPETKRKLITNHHVFAYLAQRYGFTVMGAIVPSGTTLASPSASDLASLVGAISDNGISTIFVDTSQPDRLARVLADSAGIDVDIRSLYSESLGGPGSPADTYLNMMRFNASQISDGLRAAAR
ncbi:zinc ABC transporter substrate-binding protein AztC [Rhodococcus sp. ACT016]|uniref:zinc ABC transporter substrate-binding protein AztC n=1 Tax=Rhodococcus sp. ACT016 TaxID=3134808 RepID=UPI003D282F8E